MGHSVDSNITNRYIDAFPLAQQMEFNSRLLKLNDDADKGVDSAGEEFLKSWGNPGKCLKNLGGIGDLGIKNLGGIGKDFC